MATPLRYLKSFVARDDDGARYTLRVYASSIDVEMTTTGRPGARMRGLRRIKLDDATVTYVQRGEYRTRAGQRLTSDDPDAE